MMKLTSSYCSTHTRVLESHACVLINPTFFNDFLQGTMKSLVWLNLSPGYQEVLVQQPIFKFEHCSIS